MADEHGEFDLMGLNLCGERLIMPKRAAMMLFEALQGSEIYQVSTWYAGGNYSRSEQVAHPLPYDRLPTLTTLNPVVFHTMRINHEKMEAEEEEKRKAKEGKQ